MSSVCQDFTSCHCIGQAVWCGQSCSTCLGNEGQDLVSFSIACLAPLPALSLPDVKAFSDSFQLSHERAVSCFSAQLMSELSFVTSPCCRCIGHLYIDRVVKFVKSHDSLLSFHPGMYSELWNSLVSPVWCGRRWSGGDDCQIATEPESSHKQVQWRLPFYSSWLLESDPALMAARSGVPERTSYYQY